jgi:nitroimidazol reductase NimA-like FMN-containing flavoprotein (pyridoxamine 5'-phosphate oxidase superfamily)
MRTDRPESANIVEVLERAECERLLASHDIGRIAFSLGGVPEIFPVNYASDGSTVIFRTSEGTRLARSAMQRAAFEVDEFNPTARIAWSVVVQGVVVEITDSAEPLAIRLREKRVVPLAPGAHERWMAIYSSNISGRRFRTSTQADGATRVD